MKEKEKVKNYLDENGYLFSKDMQENNISEYELREAVSYNNIERIAHGVYIKEDIIPDFYFILSMKNQKIVFSHESALYLNNLTEKEPDLMTVTIPRGYNATHLREKGIKIISKDKDLFNLDFSMIKTNLGNYARTYDLEKSVCDMIKYKNKFDIEVYTYALKEYLKRKDKDIHKLIEYEKILKIEDEVRTYLEVLL